MKKAALISKITPRVATLVILVLFGPATSLAGEVYGRVAKNGAVFSNASVTITCSGFNETGQTNSNGAYRLNGPSGENQCKISVSSASNSITVFTSQSRTRVNLEVTGNRLLRR